MKIQRIISRHAICFGLLGLVILLFEGCALKRDPEFAPSRPLVESPLPQNDGAIYQAATDVRLFEDRVARRVGDVLTVVLVENTNVTKNDQTNQRKNSDTSLDTPIVFGYPMSFMEQNIAMDRKLTANNRDTQNYNLHGTLSVTVVEVLGNGNMVVRGEKRLGLTGGNEYVKFSGIVRPVDVDVANTVPSTSVADATIVYEGEGQMADTKKQGWLQRFFNSPYFPF
ncbi:MAG: flagellar basal body L-ring protein FlgH [Gammaproteobacteria bacterium]